MHTVSKCTMENDNHLLYRILGICVNSDDGHLDHFSSSKKKLQPQSCHAGNTVQKWHGASGFGTALKKQNHNESK